VAITHKEEEEPRIVILNLIQDPKRLDSGSSPE
jgi:hypothetical protein